MDQLTLENEVVELVRIKLGLLPDTQLLENIRLSVQEVGQNMRNYLNRSDIPYALKFAWMRLTVGVFKAEYANVDEIAALTPASVKSITDAETKVDFATGNSFDTSAAIASAIRNIDSEISMYRVLRMPGSCR